MSIDSPRLADPTLTYGQVIITENDNARGILQLSASFVSVAEGHLGNVVMVTRSAGRFGLVSRQAASSPSTFYYKRQIYFTTISIKIWMSDVIGDRVYNCSIYIFFQLSFVLFNPK